MTRGATLVELLFAVTLLSVILLGLGAMVARTLQAFAQVVGWS